jgi:anaerobic dimethyl sulfoxide reductase subunit C (anchor subunit)
MIKERSLLIFTLLMQASVGTCIGMQILGMTTSSSILPASALFSIGWAVCFILAATGLMAAFFHLKVPLHAWRALANLKTSWLSREIFFASIYTASLLIIATFQFFPATESLVVLVKWIVVFAGLAMIFCMGSAYRLKTVKFWDSPQTILTFYASAVVLGILICSFLEFVFMESGSESGYLINRSAGILASLILINSLFSYKGFQRLAAESTELLTDIKKILFVRIGIGILAAILSGVLILSGHGITSVLIWPAIVSTLLSELSGRALFYAAQVPSGVYLLNE